LLFALFVAPCHADLPLPVRPLADPASRALLRTRRHGKRTRRHLKAFMKNLNAFRS